MVITEFIKYLNETKNWNLRSDYYSYIDMWKSWWEGYVPSFHEYKETGVDGVRRNRQLFRMNMAKQICEDWASLTLNDKTTFTIKDKNTAKWLLGNKDQTGGILRSLKFWNTANKLGELMYRSGTGAFVVSCENVRIDTNTKKIIPSKTAKIIMDYNPAECIIPITVKHGDVTECAFASEVFVQGKKCVYLQIHEIVTKMNELGEIYKTYKITNEYYESIEEAKGDDLKFRKINLPQGMISSFETGSLDPWFALIKPNNVKNIDGGSGLGVAIFNEAIDQIKHCDTAFNNYHRDLYLGGKKLFYSKRLLQETLVNGQMVSIAPDDVQQQLFWQDTSADPGSQQEVYDYNPALRADENSKAVQDALDYLSFKVGLGTHHYQFQNGGVTTATEYIGNRQDMVQHANKHQIEIESGLIQIIKAMIYVGKNVCGANVDPETEITVNWDDSYISDSETRRLNDKQDALDGFIPKYMYNMEWHGMSEEEARKAVEEAEQEGTSKNELSFNDDYDEEEELIEEEDNANSRGTK